MDDEFDTEVFISAIRERPILWKTSHEEYHDRAKKQSNWLEVAKIMYPTMDEECISKSDIEALMKKWKNLRDTYLRSMKKQNRSGSVKKKRKYIYSKEMSFLNSEIDFTTENSVDGEASPDESSEQRRYTRYSNSVPRNSVSSVIDEVCMSSLKALESASSGNQQNTDSTGSTKRKESEETIINYMPTPEVLYKPDEDQSFFDSILPTVRQFNVDQKFEFRIQVMSIIQNMRRNHSTNQSTS